MPADNTDQLLAQTCLDALQHMLDLAMQTADAASAEKNHKLVLQAVREVTRLVTLMDKLTRTSKRQPAAQITQASAPAAKPPVQHHLGNKWEKGGKKAGKNGSIESFFKENKQLIHSGRNTVKSALTNAAVNPVSEQAEGAASDFRWQDKPVVLAAEEVAAAQR